MNEQNQPGPATMRVMQLREVMMKRGVEQFRAAAAAQGIPPHQFNGALCREKLDQNNSVMVVAILEYLDEAAKSGGLLEVVAR